MNNKLTSFLYGQDIAEAMVIDMILRALKDGEPHKFPIFETPSGPISGWELDRKIQFLFDDKMIVVGASNAMITSKGLLHLSKGGYVAQIKHHKNSRLSFWLSVTAIIISIVTAIFSFFNN